MMASMLAFTLNDAMIKLVSDNLGIYQIMFIRGVFSTLILGIIAWYSKSIFPTLSINDWKYVGYRLIGEVGATLCFLMALFNMPIANASAILQSLPLGITLAAAVFLGEPVGWRRYLAIIIGFIGVIIVVRPGSEGFNSYSIFAMVSVAFIVVRDLATRRLSKHVPSIFVALSASVSVTVAGAVMLPTMAWQPVNLYDLEMLGGAALLIILGYIFAIMTMRVGEISFISPFRYTSLIWSVILGLLLFSEIPDTWTIVGSTIVVLTGVYTFYREQKVKHPPLLD